MVAPCKWLFFTGGCFSRLDSIVHLEILNILVALRAFSACWSTKKVLIKCDNAAVVDVLTHGKTKDPFLATCARNIWQVAALHDIKLVTPTLWGIKIVLQTSLSRWSITENNF